MDKQEIISNLLSSIMKHCIDMKYTLDENELDESVKSRLAFEIFYVKFAIQNIEYYL